jgi:hypothetical protein
MEAIMEASILLGGLVVFGLATLRWGSDSREPFRSPEWERRRRWRSVNANSRPR